MGCISHSSNKNLKIVKSSQSNPIQVENQNNNEKDKKKKMKKLKTLKKGKIIDAYIDEFKLCKSFLAPENKHDPYEYYSIVECLGEGSFGQVFKVKHKLTGDERAMKIINKYSSLLSEEDEENTLKEIKILRMLDHPNIIKIYEFYNTKRKLFIITELCTGGELFDRIVEVNFFSEVVAAHIIKQILSATAFCHANKIIHRDLKPENILIENANERKKNFFNIKVIDFGTGEVNKNKTLSEKTGTAYYIAPEVLKRKYNEKCDLWSCGVILYILLCGSPPFSGKTDDEIFKNISKGSYTFKGNVWNDISTQAKDLISKLLVKDIDKRLSAEEALSHDWFDYIFSQKSFELIEKQRNSYKMTHLNEIVMSIKNFRAEKKLQQASLSYIVHNLTSSEDCKELRNIFIAFDLNGDGRLTKDELIQGMCQVMTKGEAEYVIENIMNMIDIDKSGYIEYEEFLRAAIKKEKILSRDNIRHAFNMFDKDKSGYISKLELKEILGSGKNSNMKDDVWISMVNEIDDNSDGMISYEEFCEMMNKLIV